MLNGGGLRRIFERLGYVLWKREYLRFGIDPFLDVNRISARWGRKIDTVFDVGANIGQTATEALKAFPQARVWSFEPQPSVYNMLRLNVGDARFSTHNLALGEKQGTVTMYEYGDSGGASHRNSLVPNARSTEQWGNATSERAVECTTLDAFCAAHGIGKIDLLKIDVEGFELSVLKGAEQMLKDGKIGFVYFEFNDVLPVKDAEGGSLVPLAEYLNRFGMRYLTTYTDFLFHEGRNDVFVVANALFALPPR